MIGAVTMWNLALVLAIVIPCSLGLCFIAFLIHKDCQNEVVSFKFSFPRFIPWSIASKARKVRAEVELEQAKEILHEQKHRTLQKQLVLSDLENEQYKRALEP